MFTVEQISIAHNKVRTGADFPLYIREIVQLGVIAFETRVIDSQTQYFGHDNFQTSSNSQYDDLKVTDDCNPPKFLEYLRIHQQGKTDYFTFCNHCAETGIERWYVSLSEMTCTYYDKAGNKILEERIPQ